MKIKITDIKTGNVTVVTGEVVDNAINYFTVETSSKNNLFYHVYPKRKYHVEIQPASIYRVDLEISYVSEHLGEIETRIMIPADIKTYPHLELYLNQIFGLDDISVSYFEEFNGYPIKF